MKATELIRWALRLTSDGTERLVADMRDAPLTPSTPGARSGDGNSPLWSLGHLCFIEGSITELLTGEKNPVAHWAPLFATGTEPRADGAGYPSFDEALASFKRLRDRNLRLLDEIGEAGLDRPPVKVPPGFEDAMKTTGHALLLAAIHNMVHYGQIADARRVAGLRPLM